MDCPRLPDVPSFVFKESLGPFHGTIRCLIEDDLGWMWFGTDQGVYRVPLQNLIAVAEGRTNRVQTEIFQEAVNNAIKHAQASQLNLRLTLGPDAFLLDIDDNGSGLPPEIQQRPARGNASGRPGIGGHELGNIRKRIEESGGTCEFLPNTPKGLRVRVRTPHNRPA